MPPNRGVGMSSLALASAAISAGSPMRASAPRMSVSLAPGRSASASRMCSSISSTI